MTIEAEVTATYLANLTTGYYDEGLSHILRWLRETAWLGQKWTYLSVMPAPESEAGFDAVLFARSWGERLKIELLERGFRVEYIMTEGDEGKYRNPLHEYGDRALIDVRVSWADDE